MGPDGDDNMGLCKSDDGSKKLFECDVCNMKFSNGANMRRHRMRHTGVKPYECRICQKRYQTCSCNPVKFTGALDNLTIHLILSTDFFGKTI